MSTSQAVSLHEVVELSPLTVQAYRAACVEVLKRLPPIDIDSLRWRHHGLGMLQAELSEELRVHVWHPKLRTVPSESFRDVHDHRFTLLSCVVVGAVTDVPYDVVPYDYGRHGQVGWDHHPRTEMHEILHAKIQRVANVTRKVCDVYAARHEALTYRAGSVYAIRRRCFHTTQVNDLAVTVVHRSDFDGEHARILGSSEVVGSAIVPENVETLALRNWVLREAYYALQDSFR